ncbi:MAG: hydrogen peroxide-inducible genes activator [Bdellovibrionales bacterium]
MTSLRHIRTFLMIAEKHSFRAAAEALNLTQPAVSLQMQEMETQLGLKLFERNGRRADLTRAGIALLPKARAIMDAVTHLTDSARSLNQPLTGRLRLGVIPTIGPYLLPRLLPRITKDAPHLALQVVEDKTENLVAALRRKDIDVALLALPLHQPDLAEQALFDDAFMLAVPEKHALAKQKNPKEIDILNGPLLLLDEGHCLRDQALGFCKAPRHAGQTEFRAASLQTLTELVAHGLGVTLLPAMAAQRDVQPHHGIKIKPLQMKGASRTIGLAWRKNSPADDYLALGKIISASRPR